MVLQCSKLLYYKVSSEFLRQDSQSSYSFGKIQNVGKTEVSEEKNLVFHWRKVSYFVFIHIFPLVLLLISSFQIHNIKLARRFLLTHIYTYIHIPLIYTYIYIIYIYIIYMYNIYIYIYI